MKVDESAGAAASAPFFQRAVEIDAQFAMAWANLGLDYSEVGESVLSAEKATKAWQLRDQQAIREGFSSTSCTTSTRPPIRPAHAHQKHTS
jgi:hypothetical protein